MKKILLADDEINIRILVRTTLEESDILFLEAKDGHEALEMARRERPDLVILDWMMPGLSGIEVAERLRLEEEMADVAIVMLTAKGQQADVERGRRAKVDAYFVKPFSPLELMRTIEELLDD